MPDGTTVLDRRQLEQALLVLDRERPSPSDETRFEALAMAVWLAIGLTAAWAVAFIPLHDLAYYLFRAAVSASVVAMALFFANLNLVAKMWREALARRRSRLLPNWKAFVRARHRQHLVAIWRPTPSPPSVCCFVLLARSVWSSTGRSGDAATRSAGISWLAR